MQTNDIVSLLRQEVVPAIGCTEPMCVALCVARAKEKLGAEPDAISIEVSKNIYKNAMGVGIPCTGMTGLPIAVALGATIGKSEYMLEVLRDTTPEAVEYAKQYMQRVPPHIIIAHDAPDMLYVHAVTGSNGRTAEATIQGSHTCFADDSLSGEAGLSSVSDSGLSLDPKELALIQRLTEYPSAVRTAGEEFSPAVICNYAYALACDFNSFYHDLSILNEPDGQKKALRLLLAANVAKALRSAMALLGIEMPERM